LQYSEESKKVNDENLGFYLLRKLRLNISRNGKMGFAFYVSLGNLVSLLGNVNKSFLDVGVWRFFIGF
jgi:hypothetical protein